MTCHEEIHAGKAPGTSTGHDGAEAPHKLPLEAGGRIVGGLVFSTIGDDREIGRAHV